MLLKPLSLLNINSCCGAFAGCFFLNPAIFISRTAIEPKVQRDMVAD